MYFFQKVDYISMITWFFSRWQFWLAVSNILRTFDLLHRQIQGRRQRWLFFMRGWSLSPYSSTFPTCTLVVTRRGTISVALVLGATSVDWYTQNVCFFCFYYTLFSRWNTVVLMYSPNYRSYVNMLPINVEHLSEVLFWMRKNGL